MSSITHDALEGIRYKAQGNSCQCLVICDWHEWTSGRVFHAKQELKREGVKVYMCSCIWCHPSRRFSANELNESERKVPFRTYRLFQIVHFSSEFAFSSSADLHSESSNDIKDTCRGQRPQEHQSTSRAPHCSQTLDCFLFIQWCLSLAWGRGKKSEDG